MNIQRSFMNFHRVHFIILILGMQLFSACEKNNCPVPAFIDPIVTHSPVLPELKEYNIALKQGSDNGKDAFITLNYLGGNNKNPDAKTLFVDAWTNGGDDQIVRAVIDFNLNSLPVNAVITKAELVLYADTVNPLPDKKGHTPLTGPNDWVIKKIKTPWEESTITWNNQPETYDQDAIFMPASTSRDQAYIINLTSFITDKYKNPSSHYGYLMKLNNESTYRSLAFCSSEHQYPQLRPELRLTFLAP